MELAHQLCIPAYVCYDGARPEQTALHSCFTMQQQPRKLQRPNPQLRSQVGVAMR